MTAPGIDPRVAHRQRHDAALRAVLATEAGRIVLSELLSQTGVLSTDGDVAVRALGLAIMDHVDDVTPGDALRLLSEQDHRRRELEGALTRGEGDDDEADTELSEG